MYIFSYVASKKLLMTMPKTIATLFLMTLLNSLGVPEAWAIRPLYGSFTVVAGSQYTARFKDGSFDTACFNQPLGLSASDDGNRLFVADSGNNRIRVVHLDQNNEVTTLAGQDKAGNSDGPFAVAQFNDPRGVLYLPGDRLVVNDFGNKVLRFVDLKAGKVTTFTGGTGQPGSLEGIKDMAYLSSAHSIFLTQPDAGVLNVLNLETRQLTTVLKNNVQIPHPSALWIRENKIYVADRDLKNIFSMDWMNNAVTNIAQEGMAPKDKVLSLCSSDGILYSLLGIDGFPAQRWFIDKKWTVPGNGETVDILNALGDTIPPDKFYRESPQPNSAWIGFVPDPSDKRKLFYSIPNLNIIVSLRDQLKYTSSNSHGIFGPEYAIQKPKNTYRIMMVGDCRTTECDAFPFPAESHPVLHPADAPYFAQQLGLTSQIERALNFQAALDNNPMNYEVLNFGRHGDLIFWPSIDVPAVAKLYDVDLLIVFSPALDGNVFDYYFSHNLTADGIPQYPPDMEYLLKPPLQRIPDGLPRKFYDYCKEHNWVKLAGRKLVFDDKVLTDPKLHDMILEFWGKPWDVLNRKLSAMKTSFGKPAKMLVLFTYTGVQSGEDYKPDLFKEVAGKYNIPYYDLIPTMNALHLSFYGGTSDGDHFDPDGCKFYGNLLARVLPREKLIPWPTPEKESKK